jgi:outer membrane protein TolC
MLLVRRTMLVLSAFSWAGPRLCAQPVQPSAAGDAVLEALVAEALVRNPDLQAAEAAVTAARARPDQARALPDPMLSVTYTNDGWSPTLGQRDMTTLGFLWSQDLPFPGKRRLRGEITSLEADAAAQQVERARLSLTAAVERAYCGLVLARDLLDLVGEQEETWKEIEQVTRARYAVGQGAQQDVLRVQVEVTRIEQRRAEQQTEVEIRLAELNRLRDRPPATPIDTTAHLGPRSVEEGLPEAIARLTERSPELKSAGLGLERDRLAVALANKEFKPDLSVQAGYMNRGGLDPMWQAGVGVSLPVSRKKRQGAVAEAEARLRESERRTQSLGLQLRFRTEERLAQLRSAERIADLYGNGIIPQDQMSVQAAIANYQVGRVPFIAVLEALSTLYGDRTTYLRLLASHEKVRASLEEASLEATSDLAIGAPDAMGAARASSMGRAGPAAAGSGPSMSMANPRGDER